MNGYEFLLGEDQTLRIPGWWFDAMLVWSGVVGAVLWLFGRQLVKPMFAILMAGAVMLAVALGVRFFSEDMPLTWWMVGAGVVGAAVGWLLARLALALLFAVCLAIVVPWMVVVAQGHPLPDLREPVAEVMEDLREQMAEAIEVDEAPPEAENADNAENAEPEPETRIDREKLPELAEAYQRLREEVVAEWRAWWDELSSSAKLGIVSAAGGTLVVGVALAFVLPNLVGALMMSWLGVMLMVLPVRRAMAFLPDEAVAWIPREGWPLAALLVGFVLLGALIQWAIFRERREE